MRFAVCSICYNESEYVQACIRNWQGLVDEHLVLVSTRPWNGSGVRGDDTARLARKAGAKVVESFWATEAEQRNYGLELLRDYDYVLIVDPDEFYTPEDQKIIMDHLNNPINPNYRTDRYTPGFRAGRMATYWKTPDYTLSPPDKHKPFIAVDPKYRKFAENRQIDATRWVPLIPITCHHMSWVKSDDKIKEKIQSFSHASAIRNGWYENVWKVWKPDCGLLVRPYGGEESTAIYNPAPESIKNLLENKC